MTRDTRNVKLTLRVNGFERDYGGPSSLELRRQKLEREQNDKEGTVLRLDETPGGSR